VGSIEAFRCVPQVPDPDLSAPWQHRSYANAPDEATLAPPPSGGASVARSPQGSTAPGGRRNLPVGSVIPRSRSCGPPAVQLE